MPRSRAKRVPLLTLGRCVLRPQWKVYALGSNGMMIQAMMDILLDGLILMDRAIA
ncbi:hypothetical protein KSF_037090 [Reticulibacter mediterranei]|uniref:Uncharacterized protein n=1 Tax=Reticulibacter mediterranei TaxID=2778369 RepID=A0A8J3INM0_9CHLR|nr:hypothetical protein KSF_037090 [Reticulibacter mediterranei]